MARWTVVRTIAAPTDLVFSTVAEPENFRQARAQVTKIEFQSDTHSGVGTRFRETRRMKDKESTTDLEIREYELGRRVRFVADSHGTVWDSVYTLKQDNGSTVLSLTMDAFPQTWLPRLMTFLISGILQAALEGDMDAVKAYCEGQARSHS